MRKENLFVILSFMNLFVLFFIVIPLSAFAYLDPGTGSFIIHIIVGGLIGITYWARISWRKITAAGSILFSKFRSHRDQDESSKTSQ